MKQISKSAFRGFAGVAATVCALSSAVLSQPVAAADPFIGQVVMFGGNFAPRGWALCEGQLLSISSNQALFSILGTIYGGNGRDNFALPDLRGRAAIHPGNGPGLSNYILGQKGGAEQVTLSQSNMPAHSHTASATATLKGFDGRGDESNPVGHSLAEKSRTNIYKNAAPDVAMHPGSVEVQVTVNNAGGGQSHENRMPYLAVNHIIALVGTFPSRN